MKITFKIVLLVFIGFFLYTPAMAEGLKCLICHGAVKGKIEKAKGVIVDVYINEERFSKSVHGSLDCTACHVAYQGSPHKKPGGDISSDIAELVPFVRVKSKVDPVAHAACVQCHEPIYKALKESIHGENIFTKKETDGPLCLDCHGSPHYIVPKKEEESKVYKFNILHTCGDCHDKKELAIKYNWREEIIYKYEHSFHGKKYQLGHKKTPICNDCHGAHDVKKWDDPASPVAWENRIKTCGKCHKGAGKKFVSAMTHKKVGKDNPIPYYSEKMLIILTLSVFAFTISHVLLEAYSELRDYLRKEKEESHEE